MVKNRPAVSFVLAVVVGPSVWIGIAMSAGVAEAWDHRAYWQVGYPVLAIASGIGGYFAPRQAWRWPLIMMVSQMAVLLVQKPTGNLLPLGIIAFLVLAAPLLIPAYIGAALALDRARRADAGRRTRNERE